MSTPHREVRSTLLTVIKLQINPKNKVQEYRQYSVLFAALPGQCRLHVGKNMEEFRIISFSF